MSREANLKFYGPLWWCASPARASILEVPMAQKHGIYIWTAPTRRGEVILYVGETGRSFASRMEDHLRLQLSGMYDIDDPSALRLGRSKTLWRGMLGPDREDSILDYVRRLPRLAPDLVRYIRTIRFYVAPLTARRRHRERIEAAIVAHLRDQDEFVRQFQDPNVRYRPRRRAESPVHVQCKWPVPLEGAPQTLEA